MKKVAEFNQYKIYSEMCEKFPEFTFYIITEVQGEGEESTECPVHETITFYEAVQSIKYWIRVDEHLFGDKKKQKITVDIHLSDK